MDTEMEFIKDLDGEIEKAMHDHEGEHTELKKVNQGNFSSFSPSPGNLLRRNFSYHTHSLSARNKKGQYPLAGLINDITLFFSEIQTGNWIVWGFYLSKTTIIKS
jgi:hypothetical protein